jgi:acetyl esterase/lipase
MNYQKIAIWEHNHYAGMGPDGFQPTLTTYMLDGEHSRAAVLICPGGGYRFVSSREAEPIALQFAAAGLHAFVLDYSVAPRRYPQALLDLARAMCLIRENAAIWRVDAGKIALCGFSAGGHLAASLIARGDRAFLTETPGITPKLISPNALILGYPVITSGPFAHQGSFAALLGEDPDNPLRRQFSLELQVSPETPPVFLWHTLADQAVPVENSLLYAQALRDQGIPFELHIFPQGPHGLALATPETDDGEKGVYPHVSRWMGLCLEWLKETFESENRPLTRPGS